jgi:error-prone DNA polymerase
VLVNDAKRHGVMVLPVDVNLSQARCTLEEGALRLGFLMVKGVGPEGARAIEEARVQGGPFRSVRDFARRTGLKREALENLVQAGAFDCLGLTRRELLWQVWLVERWRSPMDGLNEGPVASPALPDQGPWDVLGGEYGALGLSTALHPLQLMRQRLERQGVANSALLGELPDGAEVRVAGMVVCRPRPPTAKGFAFLTLEDEYGMVNVVVPPRVYQACRLVIRTAPLVVVTGALEKRHGVVNLRAFHVQSLRPVPPGTHLPDGLPLSAT